MDFEGPSNPSDAKGNRYVLSYICCLCHAVLLEPCTDLKHSEVRRGLLSVLVPFGNAAEVSAERSGNRVPQRAHAGVRCSLGRQA